MAPSIYTTCPFADFPPKAGSGNATTRAGSIPAIWGKNWHKCAAPFGDQAPNFNMLALTAAVTPDNPDGKYVYALGTPCGRFGAAKLGRVSKERILDGQAWEIWLHPTATGRSRPGQRNLGEPLKSCLLPSVKLPSFGIQPCDAGCTPI